MRSARHHLKLELLIRVLLGTSLIFVLEGCKKPEATPAPEVTVQATQAKLGSISDMITADATLAPVAQAAISPKVTAPVKKFYVQRGTRVRAGQLLATLENSDLSAAAMDNRGAYTAAKAGFETATKATVPEEYSKAQLDLTQAKANLELNQSIVASRTQLFAQGAIPGRDLDTAKAALVQAQVAYDIANQHFEAVQRTSNSASIEAANGQLASAKGKYLAAEAQLSYSEIRSPIDGFVTDRPLFVGETAAAGTPLITVMETSVLIAKLHIAQVQAQELSVGDAATIRVPGVEDTVDAKVSLISPALDPGSTTVEVWLRIDNPKNKLKAGTPVHAMITGHTIKNALLLPPEAIQTAQDGGKYVMVIAEDSTAHKRPVMIGIQTGKEVQIASGVSLNDRVVTTGSYAMDDGTRVKIAAPDEQGGSAGDGAAARQAGGSK